MGKLDCELKKQLFATYEAKNLQKFICALDDGGNPYERDGEPETEESVFEKACKEPGSSEFIKACIERRDKVKSGPPPDVNAVNQNTKKCPIHLAALSYDEGNLSELLQCKDVQVDKKFDGRTALLLLFEELGKKNQPAELRGKMFANIKLLLKNGADINEPNEANVVPLCHLLTDGEDWRKEILEYCIDNHALYLDARRNQLRKAIENQFPMLMPKVRLVDEPVFLLRKKLETCIRDCDQEQFLSEYEKFCEIPGAKLTPSKRQEMIEKTVSKKMLPATQKLMEVFLVDGKLKDPGIWVSNLLEVCCMYGYVEAVEWFLQIIPRTTKGKACINNKPLLTILVKQIAKQPKDSRCDFFSCMEKLLVDERCEIDKRDPLDCTALHHAAMERIDEAQELLLKNGAYLGSKDVFGNRTISLINPALLERHLDLCITGDKLYSTNDYKKYELKIDFRNFVPPEDDKSSELVPVVQLARSFGSSRELLRHPVITSMLLLKWHLLSWCFYTNTIVCAIFFLSFMTYLVLDVHTNTSAWIPELISWVGLGYIALREILQLVLTCKSYFKSKVNWLELFLITTCVIVLARPTMGHGYRQALSIVACGLLTVEFVLLIGTLPNFSISTHMVMLKRVATNFLKLLIPYCVILFPLGVMFHLLYQTPHANKPEQKKSTETNTFGTNVSSDSTVVDSAKDENSTSDDGSFNNFDNIGQALVKMFVMFTGEFEAANLHLHESIWRTVLFLTFLFVAFCVLYNVMNGVAVGDTGVSKM
ncbi:AGAP013463-PA-like protein [Anopheles sinensis]|uniref:AGAP013463-PA-like protein n=1 Tax=Anopheles sinensis TaxID=74873 RepID=A0A084WCN3_ANOSI|nr:AGAP013463-PA-like protein [Anopheles sinensis]